MGIRAILFDVGGPLDTEVEAERLIDAQIREAVESLGLRVTDEAYAEASRWAVNAFAPNTYQAIIWRLCGGRTEIAEQLRGWASSRRRFELRAGIPELLRDLYGRGLLLGLAANQPVRVLEELDRLGIGQYFAHRQVSGHHGFRKPDVRLFLRACDDLGVEPDECVMVGDRVDNDIAPAKLLGMRAVLFRTGRHIDQQPRCYEEAPDAEAWDVDQLRAVLFGLL